MTDKTIQLDHGSGGESSRDLVESVFLTRLGNDILSQMDDSAVVTMPGRRLAMTTDSYVVDPVFFPGGNIGSLSVHGTVNDLSMQGAIPRYLTLGLILEEGFPLDDLITIVDSVAAAAEEAQVRIVAGDTKVVPRGHADKIFVNTAGVGEIPSDINVASNNARPGDKLIINGDIGDHGMAVLTSREGLEFNTSLSSDSAPLNGLVHDILAAGYGIHVLRDPTRGGVATALNEIAARSSVGIEVIEQALPINVGVKSASEILGLDPLYVANEGKCLVFASSGDADAVLNKMRQHPYGKKAAIIGEAIQAHEGRVLLKTRVGGTRILSMLTGEQLPRIC